MRPRPVAAQRGATSRTTRTLQLDVQLRKRLAPLGMTFTWSPTLVLGGATAGLLLMAVRFGGSLGFMAVLGALVLGWLSLERIGAAMLRRRSDRMLPELALRLARSLRSGLPPERAIEHAASELDDGHPRFALVAAQLRAGRPVVPAVESWLRSASGDAEQLLAAGLLLGIQHGGDLATAIDGVGEGLRDDLDLDARRRVLLTQSRMSAAVLVGLPVAFALVASGLHGGSIYEGTMGVGLLVAGVLLDLVGVLWMRSLMRGLS